MKTDRRSENQRHQNLQKPHLRKGSGGGANTGASNLQDYKDPWRIGHHLHHHNIISTIFTIHLIPHLVVISKLIVDLHNYLSISSTFIHTIMMMFISSVCE
jgi:hypothetical protein